jgi:hypothetical protein
MKIEGYKIRLAGVPSCGSRPAAAPAAGANRRADSADTSSLAWMLLDPEPERTAGAAIEAAVRDGSYWVSAHVLGRSLVAEHIWVGL